MIVRETVTVPRVSPFSYCTLPGRECQIIRLKKALHYRHKGTLTMMRKPAVMGLARCAGARCSARLKFKKRALEECALPACLPPGGWPSEVGPPGEQVMLHY